MSRPPTTYQDLLHRTDGPAGTTWGLFGAQDQRGAANFAGASQVRAAAGEVTEGAVLSLDYSLDAFAPPLFAPRDPPVHEITSLHPNQRDDVVREFYPQAATQVDGLRHRRAQGLGFYNGVSDARIVPGTPDLGVQMWADAPIVGRGVLVDVWASLEQHGTALSQRDGESIALEDLERAIDEQGCALEPGDLLLLHTGWAAWYFAQPETVRAEVRADGRYPGIAQSSQFLAWLYEHRIALVAADNPAFEAVPPAADSPFRESAADDKGMMHQELIAKLGLPVGELWRLDQLSAACRQRRAWTFLLVVKPLSLTGGVGSPANAVAIW